MELSPQVEPIYVRELVLKIPGRAYGKKNRPLLARGRLIPNKDWQDYKTWAVWCIKDQLDRQLRFHSLDMVEVYLTMWVKRHRGHMPDLDNVITSILDILQEAEIIPNDKNVMAIKATKIPVTRPEDQAVWVGVKLL